MSEFNLRIVTPYKLFFEDKVQGVIVQTTEGEMMVLPNHISFAAILKVSKATIKQDNKYRDITLAGGLLQVSKEAVTIISHAAEYVDEIDLARAEEAKSRLEEQIKKTDKSVEVELLEFKLKKSINRINAKQ
ncbi:MAG: ATP synthase F1 subunit epsilon [Peptostreptococcaceae bacterium]|nr:ATP synthase F1 subunit epsilon [Peptostreptococcaceae bacterium]